jgi:hypothetical protein
MLTYMKQQTTSSISNAYGQPNRMDIAFLVHSDTEETTLYSEITFSPLPVTISALTVQKSTDQSKPCEATIILSGAEQNVLLAPFTTFLKYPTPSANNDKSSQLYRSLQTILPPNHASAKPVPPKVRASRPAYNDEQKFFIMYMRVIKELSWPEIKQEFNTFFARNRSQAGLTCEYYRIRKEYGMKKVDSDGPNDKKINCGIVKSKASSQPEIILRAIGYKGLSNPSKMLG